MSILLVLVILSFLVLIHEFGHFWAAKKVGVRVDEFGIGYPPRVLRLFRWRGTDFTLNLLPFGGFVRLFGDDAETVEMLQKPSQRITTVVNKVVRKVRRDGFEDQSMMGRLTVIVAGPVINIVFGVLAFAVIYANIGVPVQLEHPQVNIVEPATPASKAGMQSGDELLSLNGKKFQTTAEFIDLVEQHRGETVQLGLLRKKMPVLASAYVRKVTETPAGQGGLGVSLKDVEYHHYPWWQVPFYGTKQGLIDSWNFAAMIFRALGDMMSKLVIHQQVPSDISGPIGIVHAASKERLADMGWLAALNFAGLISINLGVMNLLPIPALDGGRAAFVLAEHFLGKKRRMRWEQKANFVGMVMLLGLIALISVKDIVGIFAGK